MNPGRSRKATIDGGERACRCGWVRMDATSCRSEPRLDPGCTNHEEIFGGGLDIPVTIIVEVRAGKQKSSFGNLCSDNYAWARMSREDPRGRREGRLLDKTEGVHAVCCSSSLQAGVPTLTRSSAQEMHVEHAPGSPWPQR